MLSAEKMEDGLEMGHPASADGLLACAVIICRDLVIFNSHPEQNDSPIVQGANEDFHSHG